MLLRICQKHPAARVSGLPVYKNKQDIFFKFPLDFQYNLVASLFLKEHILPDEPNLILQGASCINGTKFEGKEHTENCKWLCAA